MKFDTLLLEIIWKNHDLSFKQETVGKEICFRQTVRGGLGGRQNQAPVWEEESLSGGENKGS